MTSPSYTVTDTTTAFKAEVDCIPFRWDDSIVTPETHGIHPSCRKQDNAECDDNRSNPPELGVPVDVYKAFPPSTEQKNFLHLAPASGLSDASVCPVTHSLYKQFGGKFGNLNWIKFDGNWMNVDDNRVKTQLVQWTIEYGRDQQEQLRGKTQVTVIDGIEPEYVYTRPVPFGEEATEEWNKKNPIVKIFRSCDRSCCSNRSRGWNVHGSDQL